MKRFCNRNWNRALGLAAAVCLVLGLAACGGEAGSFSTGTTSPAASAAQSAPASEASSGTVNTAPGILSAFNAQDLAGNTVTQEVLEGHTLTMVNVWATFCGPCIKEMPELGELSAEYADRGVQIIGMVSDVWTADGAIDPDQVALAQEIADTTGADYLHIIPGEDLYGLLVQINTVPTTFFVDEAGHQVGSAYLGARDKEAWQKILDQMLQEVGA